MEDKGPPACSTFFILTVAKGLPESMELLRELGYDISEEAIEELEQVIEKMEKL